MDVAAGVVAFVTITAQSAKVLHDAVCTYKGGPQEVKHLLSAVDEISHVLDQLSGLFDPSDWAIPSKVEINL